MSELEKISVLFISIESLINIYKKRDKVELDNLGIIIFGKKTIICQILYKDKEIIGHPYTLKANKKSCVAWRKKIIEYTLEETITKFQLGLSSSSVNSIISRVISFVNWLDKNSLELTDDIKNAVHVFMEYTLFLKAKIRNSALKNSTARRKQSSVHELLNKIYNDKENIIGNSVSFIPRKITILLKSEKSTDEEQKYHYNFYYNMFHQIADFILNDGQFPLKMKLGAKKFWCLPYQKLFFKETDTNYPRIFNKKDGTIKEAEELAKEYNTDIAQDRYKREKFIKKLELSNQYQSKNKLFLASYGLRAFYMLFLTNTGMNDSTAATLKWNSDYEIEKKRHRFRNIKYRAGNKVVEFEIGNSFVKDFDKFIKLRNYLLCQQEFDYLFFIGSDKNASLSSQQKDGTFSSIINRRFIKHVDPDLPLMASRQLRVNKTYQTIKDNGIIAASQIAQTSINTLIHYYQGTSDEMVHNELGNYFNMLNSNLFMDENGEVETAVGRCLDFNNPRQQMLHDSFIGCAHNEGCLFCENYRLHRDQKDINKLFSLEYIINECRYIAKNENHFNSVYGVILQRIQNIIQALMQKSDITREQINHYKADVFENENLHPYWEYKLKTLVAMGVLQ